VAVRGCEIVGGASRFLVAAHLRMMLYDGTDSHDLMIGQGREKVKQNCGFIAQNFC